ncbi:hypothetical protein B0F90DRAFT_1826663 [Multifurca ochricompacta]|uniref:Flavin-containing monooxygenase n=1 Tax=Multifurca ochricompacta TaxID=376703 RepID=A0AAD4LU74_9AGAM|nr:hypothetical protein B0F90DRAFT_1826663 [Multifurca ochricompacta]
MASSQTHENTRSHSENFQLSHFAIGEYRPIKVVCIGVRTCGILAAIHFARKVPNIELTVYEKERRIGGTWFVNRYPLRTVEDTSLSSLALKSDTSIHASIQYQYGFETNVDWSGFYASGPEILAYLNRVVEKPRGMRRRANDTSGSSVMETVSFIPGLGDFRGRVLRSAQWDITEEGGLEEGVKDWGDIRPLGSSGIQLVTALQSLVKSIVNYIISKTWIGESFSLRTMLEIAGCDPGSDDCMHHMIFHRNEKYYKEFRPKIEPDLNSVAQTTIRGSDLQKLVGELFKREMKRRLAAHPELIEKSKLSLQCSSGLTVYRAVLALGRSTIHRLLSSSYTRSRLFGSFMHGKYNTPVDTNRTVHTYRASSSKTEVLNTSTCSDGLALNAHWAATGGAEAYLSIAMDDFPNLFVGGGPNLAVNSGSVTCYI